MASQCDLPPPLSRLSPDPAAKSPQLPGDPRSWVLLCTAHAGHTFADRGQFLSETGGDIMNEQSLKEKRGQTTFFFSFEIKITHLLVSVPHDSANVQEQNERNQPPPEDAAVTKAPLSPRSGATRRFPRQVFAFVLSLFVKCGQEISVKINLKLNGLCKNALIKIRRQGY